MRIDARIRTAMVRATIVGATSAATLVGSVAATAGPPPAAVISAPVAAATTPSNSCGGVVDRVVDGQWGGYWYSEGRIGAPGLVQPLSFDGVVETPRTMTLVRVFDGVAFYLAVRSNGSLWAVSAPVDREATASLISPSGWGGIRHITASRNGEKLYALTASGGLYRYAIARNLTVRGLGPIATSGWGSIRFLTDSHSSSTFDYAVAVSSDGSLRQYAINRSTGATTGGRVRPTGWGEITYIAVGGCESGAGVPMLAVHSRGGAYGYFDANATDLRGGDISGFGQIGHGFTGLVFDATSLWEGPPGQ